MDLLLAVVALGQLRSRRLRIDRSHRPWVADPVEDVAVVVRDHLEDREVADQPRRSKCIRRKVVVSSSWFTRRFDCPVLWLCLALRTATAMYQNTS